MAHGTEEVPVRFRPAVLGPQAPALVFLQLFPFCLLLYIDTVLRLTLLVLANRAVVVQDLIPHKCPPEEIRICVTAFTPKGLGFALVGVT